MLTVDSRTRASAEEILKDKVLQLRAQDYAYRNLFTQAKQKQEKLAEESQSLSKKVEELKQSLRQAVDLQAAGAEVDRQILEMRSKLKQLRFKESQGDSGNKKLFMFGDNNSSSNLPLQNIDYNRLHKRSVEIRRSFKGMSILDE